MNYTIRKNALFMAVTLSILSIAPTLMIERTVNNSKNKHLQFTKSNSKQLPETRTRQVAIFKSKQISSTNTNFFNNLKNKNSFKNSQVYLSNTASFTYQINYSNYRLYKNKKSNFKKNVSKNCVNNLTFVGTNLISLITVKVSEQGQKWANLIMTNNFDLKNTIIPSSVHYIIIGSGKINNARISLNISYENRKNPELTNIANIGYFNINNNSKKASDFFKTAIGMSLITMSVTALFVIAKAICGLVAIPFIYSTIDKEQGKITRKLDNLLENIVATNYNQKLVASEWEGFYDEEETDVVKSLEESTKEEEGLKGEESTPIKKRQNHLSPLGKLIKDDENYTKKTTKLLKKATKKTKEKFKKEIDSKLKKEKWGTVEQMQVMDDGDIFGFNGDYTDGENYNSSLPAPILDEKTKKNNEQLVRIWLRNTKEAWTSFSDEEKDSFFSKIDNLEGKRRATLTFWEPLTITSWITDNQSSEKYVLSRESTDQDYFCGSDNQ